MDDADKPAKKRLPRWLKYVLVILSVIVFVLAAIPACLYYVDWAAKRNASAFCEAIESGSAISVAVGKAKEKNIFFGNYANPDLYTFYFPSTGFDKAVCIIQVTPDGKVVSKGWEMEYD